MNSIDKGIKFNRGSVGNKDKSPGTCMREFHFDRTKMGD